MSETKKDQSKASGASAKPKRTASSRRNAAPKSQPSQAAAEKAIAEVRAIRQENEERAATHNVAVIEREISTVKGSLKVSTADGWTFVNNVVLNKDQLIELRHTLDAAFQAVS